MAWHRSAVRFYRALLFAYPAEFRREYGVEMARLFAERLRAERPFSLWAEILTDVALSAPREHLEILEADLRHSLRLFAEAPGFTCTALLALALGIGAATAVFSLINAVVLRALPYGDADRLVYFWSPLPRYPDLPKELSPDFSDVLDWQKMSRSFTAITALKQQIQTLAGGGEPVRIGVAAVLGNFFETLQAAPEMGRAISPDDDHPGRARVAVIGDALWKSWFHQDPQVLGKTVQLDRQNYRIVGVMPPGFAFPHSTDYPYAVASLKRTDIWIPAAITPQQLRERLFASDAAIGRLRPGVTLQQAQAEMSAIAKRLDPLNVPEMRGMQSLLTPFIETAAGPVRPLMRLLAGAVFLVLLIACGNVANLLMARAVDRVHEMGVRTAMGAPRARLVRQLLTESLLLAATGGALGAVLAFTLLKALVRLNPGDIPRFDEIAIDGRVLLFAVAISLATGIVFGILPALAASRVNVNQLLRQGARSIAGGWPAARHALIVTDVALAVVLLAGAGLLIRSYLAVDHEDEGFARSTLTMRLEMETMERDQGAMADLCRRVEERVAALPGVVAAGLTSALPLDFRESVSTFKVDGYPNRAGQTVDIRNVGGEFFRAMQIRLLAGRYLTDADAAAGERSVVVSESFARLYFAGRSALGGRVERGDPGAPWSTIVGVVADVRHTSPEKPPKPTLYEASWLATYLAVRTAVPPDGMIAPIRHVAQESDPTVALADIHTMRERSDSAESRRRFQTVLLAAFAGIAVFLALVGVYGLLAYSVRQRTAEIGVRMALGAGPRALVAMVVRQGLVLAGAGLALGMLASAALARWFAGMLYGVRAFDDVTFLTVPVFLLAAAAIACFVPARRAAGIDPMQAFRGQ